MERSHSLLIDEQDMKVSKNDKLSSGTNDLRLKTGTEIKNLNNE